MNKNLIIYALCQSDPTLIASIEDKVGAKTIADVLVEKGYAQYGYLESKDFLKTELHITTPVDIIPITIPKAVKTLICKGLGLKKLPKLPDTLEVLDCSNNEITELPNNLTNLRVLNCSYNFISTMVELPCCETLICNNNNLRSLLTNTPSLTVLNCGGNFIKQIPFLLTSLVELTISPSNINTLPEFKELVKLDCTSSPIKELSVGAKMKHLSINQTNINSKSLNIAHKLDYFECSEQMFDEKDCVKMAHTFERKKPIQLR